MGIVTDHKAARQSLADSKLDTVRLPSRMDQMYGEQTEDLRTIESNRAHVSGNRKEWWGNIHSYIPFNTFANLRSAEVDATVSIARTEGEARGILARFSIDSMMTLLGGRKAGKES